MTTPPGLYHIVARMADDAGITSRGVHRWRHTFALMAAKSGMPIHALQALLGHESPLMSLKYGRMNSKEATDLHRLHSPVERLELGKRPFFEVGFKGIAQKGPFGRVHGCCE